MNKPVFISFLLPAMILGSVLFSCSNEKLDKKGFAVSRTDKTTESSKIDGLNSDSLLFDTRPGRVLLTGIPQYRLTTVYKVNQHKKRKGIFIGTNSFYNNYLYQSDDQGNEWNNNFMPGLEAVYGYNMVNVSLYDVVNKTKKEFFEKPVLVKTLYYPTYSKDTLNYEPVNRQFYMVSAYDDDTNKDGFINVKDLRRFYHFDIAAERLGALVPKNYSVIKSQYDPANDFMLVYARLDENQNGQMDEEEDIHIFWIDLKNPENTGRQY